MGQLLVIQTPGKTCRMFVGSLIQKNVPQNMMRVLAVVLIAAGWPYMAHAELLAKRGGVVVNTDDFAIHHFMSSPLKIKALRENRVEIENTVNEILAPRTYNEDAPARLKLTPEEQAYSDMVVERGPLNAALNIAERRARANFDASDPKTTARARELWTVDEKNYYAEETADFTQIFFDLGRRNFSEIIERVKLTQADLGKGMPFDAAVLKYSDDANVVTQRGSIRGLQYGRADPVIGKLIFTKLTEGEISDVVSSRIGLHIVRLDKKTKRSKKPFEEVQGQVLERLLEDAAKAARLAVLDSLTKTNTVINEVGFDALLIKPDPLLEEKRRAIYRELGVPTSEPLSKVLVEPTSAPK